MKIHILTLFPDMFDGILNESILKRAQEKKLVEIKIYNLRDWANDKHKTVDDIPYGGGAGMIMKADIIDTALTDILSIIKKNNKKSNPNHIKIVLTSPKGKKFDQNIAKEYSKVKHLIIVCGHYGGADARVKMLVDEDVSIGDFVLTGGEIPAMAICDSITRLVDGVITRESLISETHTKIGRKQYPQYTRPQEFIPKSKRTGALRVPEILLSGNHALISEWRDNQQEDDASL